MSETRQLWDVPVAMRDGVCLSADIYLPAGGVEGGPYPTVLSRTPYSNQNPVYVEGAQQLSAAGYAVVLQDVRGRHDSDGDWLPFRNEGRDGYDTVEWTAEQSWSNGRIGTMGGSYGGWFQWALAREKPPHLVTMVSTAPCGDWMHELPWNNGVMMLVMFGWLNLTGGRAMQNPNLVEDWPSVFRHLPLRTMDERIGRSLPEWQDWLNHPCLDDYWSTLRFDDDFGRIDIPTLHITGWYDGDQPGALYFHRGMRASSPRAEDQYLVIGPWDHGGTRVPRRVVGDVDFGADALVDVLGLHREWFDHWLKDEAPVPLKERTRLFITGVNEWKDTPTWPPPAESVAWFLHSDGSANTFAGDGTLTADAPTDAEPDDTLIYDPVDPVPSVVDPNFYSPDAVETPLDHRFKQRRDDVLVYTSAPVSETMIVAGLPSVQLFAATDGPDTDWFVALHAVSPTGKAMLLCEGHLRGRYHEGVDHESLLQSQQIYEFSIAMSAVGHAVQPGHRLRLTVTSSDFPTWDRNPNTGHPIGLDTELRVATNRVRHQPGAASFVSLPVVPATIFAGG